MAILKDTAARLEAGMPKEYARVFSEMADKTNTIIISRASGIYAEGLIEEGYASKGFHNKAKSCNWGPMAGFVCTYKHFSKYGLDDENVFTQMEYIKGTLRKENAKETQIIISEKRRKSLDNMFRDGLNLITPRATAGGKGGIIVKPVRERFGKLYDESIRSFKKKTRTPDEQQVILYDCVEELDIKYQRLSKEEKKKSSIKSMKGFQFFLRRYWDGTPYKEILWELWYRTNALKDNEKFLPVNSFIDPNFLKFWSSIQDTKTHLIPNGLSVPKYKLATSADFDLFATWPKRLNYKNFSYTSPSDPDFKKKVDKWAERHSLIPGKSVIGHEENRKIEALKNQEINEEGYNRLKNKELKKKQKEIARFGNISTEGVNIMALLNQKFKNSLGYKAGNMVHHGSESGRPGIDDIDYPIIMFVPKGHSFDPQHVQFLPNPIDVAKNEKTRILELSSRQVRGDEKTILKNVITLTGEGYNNEETSVKNFMMEFISLIRHFAAPNRVNTSDLYEPGAYPNNFQVILNPFWAFELNIKTLSNNDIPEDFGMYIDFTFKVLKY